MDEQEALPRRRARAACSGNSDLSKPSHVAHVRGAEQPAVEGVGPAVVWARDRPGRRPEACLAERRAPVPADVEEGPRPVRPRAPREALAGHLGQEVVPASGICSARPTQTQRRAKMRSLSSSSRAPPRRNRPRAASAPVREAHVRGTWAASVSPHSGGVKVPSRSAGTPVANDPVMSPCGSEGVNRECKACGKRTAPATPADSATAGRTAPARGRRDSDGHNGAAAEVALRGRAATRLLDLEALQLHRHRDALRRRERHGADTQPPPRLAGPG